MTRIGNVDQVLLLLREQLQRAGSNREADRSGKATRANAAAPRPIERARGLAALDALSEEEVRRAVLRGLLADALGEALASDPGFQAIVDEVFAIIAAMPEGGDLLDRAVAQLRKG